MNLNNRRPSVKSDKLASTSAVRTARTPKQTALLGLGEVTQLGISSHFTQVSPQDNRVFVDGHLAIVFSHIRYWLTPTKDTSGNLTGTTRYGYFDNGVQEFGYKTTYAYMAMDLGIAERSIKHALAKLRDMGVVSTTRRKVRRNDDPYTLGTMIYITEANLATLRRLYAESDGLYEDDDLYD